jgi:hypothetical protein
MDAMNMARFNIYWYLSLLIPAFVMLIVTYKKSKPLFLAGIIISILFTYVLCNLAVHEKWRIRNQVAVTEQEKEYATADGANLVFTAFAISPLEALGYTALWGFVGRRVWSKRKN